MSVIYTNNVYVLFTNVLFTNVYADMIINTTHNLYITCIYMSDASRALLPWLLWLPW